MISFEEIQIYLPKYLSPESEKRLFDGLKQFPANIDSRLYTDSLKDNEILYQGDGVRDVLFVELPSQKCRNVNAMVLSNTCDINPEHERFLPHNVIYSPIINLDRYRRLLVEKNVSHERIESHVWDIRKQRITNVFYLPRREHILEESILLLDNVNSCKIDYFTERGIKGIRLFTLSDYGFYLFLYKLSIHFMRVREGIERRQS